MEYHLFITQIKFVHYSLFILDTLLKISPVAILHQQVIKDVPSWLRNECSFISVFKKCSQVGLYFLLYCFEMLKTDNKKIPFYSFDISHSMLCDVVPVYCLETGLT